MKSESIQKIKRILGRNVIEFFYRSLGFLSDEKYLRLLFRLRMGRKLDLDNPKTFCEKLQWLKIYGRKEIYTTMADKYLAKQFIAEKIGEKYVVPLLNAWDRFDDIDFDSLPDKFVLKCNHDSGSAIICRDKAKLDKENARKILEKSLKTDYFILKREWPYKNIKRKIIAEEYLEDEPGANLFDYKFFCLNGIPRIMYVIEGASDNPTEAFFDMDQNYLDLEMEDPRPEIPPKLPDSFDEMKRLAAKLSEGVPFLRVDFFCVKGRLYVGELTFFHESGFGEIKPKEWDNKLGDMLDLSQVRS